MILAERLHHFATAVADLDAMVAWYCEKLDFRVEKRFTIAEARLDIVKLVAGPGVRLELLKSHDPANAVRQAGPMLAPGGAHVCFHVADIEQTAGALRGRGVPLAQEPKYIAASQERNCWIEDPEGNRIEFIEEVGA